MRKRGLCRCAISVCLSVCLYDWVSVTFVYYIQASAYKHALKLFSPLGSHTILFFPHINSYSMVKKIVYNSSLQNHGLHAVTDRLTDAQKYGDIPLGLL